VKSRSTNPLSSSAGKQHSRRLSVQMIRRHLCPAFFHQIPSLPRQMIRRRLCPAFLLQVPSLPRQMIRRHLCPAFFLQVPSLPRPLTIRQLPSSGHQPRYQTFPGPSCLGGWNSSRYRSLTAEAYAVPVSERALAIFDR
jgi:hypothetical protein